MKHLDLFSGIGGFALATEMAFPNEEIEHIFCDNEPFSQAILKKHWPNAPIHGDIRQLTGIGKVDIVTGGFPCQPFSAAGRRKGTEDDRHLWPEMLRVIRETNPTYVLGENVGGLVTWDGGLVLEMVLSDLESAGYEAGAFIVPACALNAPHRRDRVWIAARNTKYAGQYGTENRQSSATGSDSDAPRAHEDEQPARPAMARADDANTHSTRRERNGESGTQIKRQRGLPYRKGNEERADSWYRNWPEVAAELCTLDDGLPDGMVRPRGWRNAALKGAGNAIVPQIAAEIMKAMIKI